MKYDELIGKLRGCDGYRCRDCELRLEDFCNPILMEKAADAMEELQKPKWISVTERLPEKGKVVLCHCRASIIETLCLEDDGHWLWYSGIYMKGFVTHWMPLPEPPKEETDG